MDTPEVGRHSRARLALEVRPEGLYLPALDLHLDPRGDVARAFVSHAHGDHAAGGAREVLASRETIALVEARRKERLGGARALEWGEGVELPISPAYGGGTARVSLAPAGHVLGAAQLIVEHPGGRLVYTGDYRTGGGATHAPGAPIACDELVIESTFALPIFLFPDRDRTRRELVAWCGGCIDAGELPVVLAYSLGKAQAVIAELVAAELPVVAHGAVYAVCEAYEALGVPLGLADGRVRAYAGAKKIPGAVLVVPPRAAAQMTKRRGNAKIAYVSGWALLDAQLERHRADAGFAWSDHADYADLLCTVRASGARHVVTTHGFADVFARVLRARGVDAEARDGAALDDALDEEEAP